MSTNPYWSGALAATPGFGNRQPIQSDFVQTGPEWDPPAMPSLPALDDARAPSAAARAWRQTQLTTLGQRYDPQLTAARDSMAAAMRGYGGWSMRQDDPNTPQREDLMVRFDPNAPMGERQNAAVQDVRARQAARGALYSGGTDTGIGQALQRMNDEMRQVVGQYATQINQILQTRQGEARSLIDDFTQMYGSDAAWLAANPILPEPPAAPTAPAQGASNAPPTRTVGSYTGPVYGTWKAPNAASLPNIAPDVRSQLGLLFVDTPGPGGTWVARKPIPGR